NKKRERQYQHVKDSAEGRGESEDTAEEIAARTVNKARAQQGESEEASKVSTKDKSPSERGGERSHSGAQGRTKDQLYEHAKRQDVEGRSTLTKDELQQAGDDRECRLIGPRAGSPVRPGSIGPPPGTRAYPRRRRAPPTRSRAEKDRMTSSFSS